MEIKERLSRRAPEDIIKLGEIVEHAVKGDFWKLLQEMTVGRKSYELQKSVSGGGVAERILGRLEAYETILMDLENMVEEKRQLQMPLAPEASPEEEYNVSERIPTGGVM